MGFWKTYLGIFRGQTMGFNETNTKGLGDILQNFSGFNL